MALEEYDDLVNQFSSVQDTEETPRKRRGRPPREQAEQLSDDGSSTPRQTRGRRTKQSAEGMEFTKIGIDIGTCAVFSGIGTIVSALTDGQPRPWWNKSPEQVQPITVPLSEYIKTMTPAMKKKIDQYAMPISLLIGVVTVMGDSVRNEMEYAQFKRSAINANVPQQQAGTVYRQQPGTGGIGGSHPDSFSSNGNGPTYGKPNQAADNVSPF